MARAGVGRPDARLRTRHTQISVQDFAFDIQPKSGATWEQPLDSSFLLPALTSSSDDHRIPIAASITIRPDDSNC